MQSNWNWKRKIYVKHCNATDLSLNVHVYEMETVNRKAGDRCKIDDDTLVNGITKIIIIK